MSQAALKYNQSPDKQRNTTPMQRIQRAAVLGAGTMGAQIAAHLANAGIPTLLLDISPRELTPDEQARGLDLQASSVRNRIARSGLEWTVVRPPLLNDKPPTGRYRRAYGRNIRGGFSIPRGDVADLMLRALDQPESIGQYVGVAT